MVWRVRAVGDKYSLSILVLDHSAPRSVASFRPKFVSWGSMIETLPMFAWLWSLRYTTNWSGNGVKPLTCACRTNETVSQRGSGRVVLADGLPPKR